MSLLSRNEIRIFVGPQQVDLVHITGRIKRQITDMRAVSFPAPAQNQPPWHRAIAALDALLEEFRHCKADVTLVLSNQFVRYVLVSHGAEANSADEEQALIQHYFTTTYGAAADHWDYRLSEGSDGEFQVASAVHTELIASLASLFTQKGLVLRSIQPHLMSAFNLLRHEIGESGWFALIEPGTLCLARIDHNQWRFLRAFNHHDNWMDELPVNLLRSKIMTNESTDEADDIPVYVFAPGHAESEWSHQENSASDLSGTRAWRWLVTPQFFAEGSPSLPLFSMALNG